MKRQTYITALFISLAFIVGAQENYKEKSNLVTEYTYAQPYSVAAIPQVPVNKAPKNIILMIGDGMGTGHLHAGLTANRGLLHILGMKYMGLSQTHSTDNYITDSAAGGTALASGKKTNNGVVGLDSDSSRITTILEYAEQEGKATGLISTSAITHATPASFIAHQTSRHMYEEIASDFLKTDIDLFIGGGYSFFANRTIDQRNLIDELKAKNYFVNQSLDSLDNNEAKNIAILTAEAHNAKYQERGNLLPQATQKALNILDKKNDKGFFLMVEGSQIDWAAHQNDIAYLVDEVLDFDRAVGKVLEFAAQDSNTLVIVTADHETGGLTILDGNRQTGYVKAHFSSLSHTGIGVPVFAYGPGAKLFLGSYDNTAIFDKMYQLWFNEQ